MQIGTKYLSVMKIISLVLVVLCFIMLFLPWATVSSIVGSGSADVFKIGSGGSGSFWSVMLIIFAILSILAMALAVVGILQDKNIFALPLAALAVVMWLFALFAVLYLKGQMRSMMGGYSDYLGGLASVHVGVGAWLFLIFGLGAYGVLFYEDYSLGRNPLDFSQLNLSGASMPKVNLSGLGGWTCPSCGAGQSGGQKFCNQCGAKRPEAPRCPGCGRVIKAGEAFCTNCGTKLR